MNGLRAQLRKEVAAVATQAPVLGTGRTPERWSVLYDAARRDVTVARLAEAHLDAVQIMTEAGVEPPADDVLGVWASDHPVHRVRAHPSGAGSYALEGSKAFCTGATLLDAALVTVWIDAGPSLVLIPLGSLRPDAVDLSGWRTPALRDTATATVDLTGIVVTDAQVVGPPGWYLDRPGFWDGAIGPAACWAGAAAALVDHACSEPSRDVHAQAEQGALVGRRWTMEALLERAGREIDEHEDASVYERRERALLVRTMIDDLCGEVQERFGRAVGPRPLVGDTEIIERDAALRLYRRQSHGARDLELIMERPTPAR